MINIKNLDGGKVLEIAQNMGYDPKKSRELEKYKTEISEMDLWDISKILFFGHRYVRKQRAQITRRGVRRAT
jgi:hypothetical protein